MVARWSWWRREARSGWGNCGGLKGCNANGEGANLASPAPALRAVQRRRKKVEGKPKEKKEKQTGLNTLMFY